MRSRGHRALSSHGSTLAPTPTVGPKQFWHMDTRSTLCLTLLISMPVKSPANTRIPRARPKLGYVARHRAPSAPVDLEIKKRIPYLRARQLPLIFGTLSGAGLAWYVTIVVRGYREDARISRTLEVPADTSDRYSITASRFDNDVNSIEWWTGIDKRRKQLCEQATGHVLEVSCGTGRNSKYLPLLKGVKSVTLVDKSREMIDEARYKWPNDGNAWFINTKFFVQDCKEKVPCPSPAGFDTIIQTMGLCSIGEPEALLKNLGNMINPDGGKILLLEHGRGYYGWLNTVLDAVAPAHARRHGCWFNKDIGALVERCGLEIVDQRRFNFGTTWWFVLRPPRRPGSDVN